MLMAYREKGIPPERRLNIRGKMGRAVLAVTAVAASAWEQSRTTVSQPHYIRGGINYGRNSKDKIPFLKIRFIPMGNNDICNIHYHKYY